LQRKLPGEMKKLREVLHILEKFDKHSIEKEFRRVCSEAGLKAKELVHPTRVALTGKRVGPGLFETMQVLGKDRVLQRLDRLINHWG
jgi:glutamyl/glutaminyl-tRNA synthetase